MAKIVIKGTFDPVAPLIRSRPTGNRDLRVFTTHDSSFAAYVHKDVLSFIQRQALAGGHFEMIGLLAGRMCNDPRTGPYTVVMAAAEAREGEFRSTQSFVRLLPEGHKMVRQRLAESDPDREIVGWYHTHPHGEPLFSSTDTDEQKNCDQNQIGIVYGAANHGEPFGVYHGPNAILLRPEHFKITPVPILPENQPRIIVAPTPPSPSTTVSSVPTVAMPARVIEPLDNRWPQKLLMLLTAVFLMVLLVEALALFTLHRRLSRTEDLVQQIFTVLRTPEVAGKVPTQLPSPSEKKVDDSRGQDAGRSENAEGTEPTKSLSPQVTRSSLKSGENRHRSANSNSNSKNEGKKRTSAQSNKAAPQKQFSSPGEQIRATAKPSPQI